MYLKLMWEMGLNEGSQEETHHTIQSYRSLFIDLFLMGWRVSASATGVFKRRILLFYLENHYLIYLYISK